MCGVIIYHSLHWVAMFIIFHVLPLSATTLCRFHRRQLVSCGREALASYAGYAASATLSKEIWNVIRVRSSTAL